MFALDASGGTGKTFLLITILSKVRGEDMIALAMATTGIASTLLPGGRTVHSKLKVPIHLNEDSEITALLKENSAIHKLIKRTKLIIIDEITMGTKRMLEAIDRTLKKILNPNLPFGGLITIFSGDWKQGSIFK